MKSVIATLLLVAAPLLAGSPVTMTVLATMDIYRAGGYDDGSDGIAPTVFSFPAGLHQVITFPSITGGWSCGNSPLYGADGSTTTICEPHNVGGTIGPFSGYSTTDFVGAMVGVFLPDNLPVFAPPDLRFYVSNSMYGGLQTNFTVLRPRIGQMFFIGDGRTGTGSGAFQVFAVPPGATHLYLGYVDSCDNTVPGCFQSWFADGCVGITLT